MNENKENQKTPVQPVQLPKIPQMPQNIQRPPLPGTLQMPKHRPNIPNMRMDMPNIKPPQRIVTRPHVFLKIGSYKSIMNSLEEMNKQITKIRSITREFAEVSRQEEQKLRLFDSIISKLNERLSRIENIFTEPEE